MDDKRTEPTEEEESGWAKADYHFDVRAERSVKSGYATFKRSGCLDVWEGGRTHKYLMRGSIFEAES